LDESGKILKTEPGLDRKLEKLSEFLERNVSHYDWVGFYLADPVKAELVLGPFAGEPTQHVRIPFGQGICGQAAERRETFVVQDVRSESNYLSCSPKVRSEIVIPIFKNGEVAGELDIDSHQLRPFTDEERTFLEALCASISDYM
jgi:L-methionine (R)-S-oxide reductase